MNKPHFDGFLNSKPNPYLIYRKPSKDRKNVRQVALELKQLQLTHGGTTRDSAIFWERLAGKLEKLMIPAEAYIKFHHQRRTPINEINSPESISMFCDQPARRAARIVIGELAVAGQRVRLGESIRSILMGWVIIHPLVAYGLAVWGELEDLVEELEEDPQWFLEEHPEYKQVSILGPCIAKLLRQRSGQ